MTISLLTPDAPGLTALVARAAQTVESILLDREAPGVESDRLLSVILHANLAAGERVGDAAWAGDAPWLALLDPRVCRDYALPYAAMVAFSELPVQDPGESLDAWEARARDTLTNPNRPWRGTRGAIRNAARPWLTGTRAVKVVYRPDGNLWVVQVRVYAAEVVDETRLRAAVNADTVLRAGQKAEVVLVAAGSTWTIGELEDAYASRTIAEFEADFLTIADVESQTGGL